MDKVTPPNVLGVLFFEQKKLIKEYTILEKLPPLPLDLQSKKGQNVIRDFLGRLTEELSEAFNELTLAYAKISTNNPTDAKKHVEDYQIEIADCIHFVLELLIFAGFNAELFELKLKKYLEDLELQDLIAPDQPLKTIINYNLFTEQVELKKFRFSRDGFRVFETPTAMGGNILSWEILEEHAKNNWVVVFSFNRAINLLKNRDWSQQTREINLLAFEEGLLKAFISFISYLDFAGFTEVSIYDIYMQKNKINHERIKTGY